MLLSGKISEFLITHAYLSHMKAQVVTIFSDVPADPAMKTYPELEKWFEKGMYVEDLVQTQAPSGLYIITFILRHNNNAP